MWYVVCGCVLHDIGAMLLLIRSVLYLYLYLYLSLDGDGDGDGALEAR